MNLKLSAHSLNLESSSSNGGRVILIADMETVGVERDADEVNEVELECDEVNRRS